MSFTLHGIGTALPAAAMSQTEALAVARALADRDVADAAWLPPVYAHAGVNTRYQALGRGLIDDLVNGTRDSGCEFLPTGDPHYRGPTTARRMAAYAEYAPPLAVRASAIALAESGFAAKSITQLVTISCTGFVSPGVDYAIITELGLNPTVERTNVGFMGCHAAVNGLRVANALSHEPGSRVLVCAVELSSVHYYYGPTTDKVIANALFADGAAAVVGSSEPAPGGDGWRVAATGSCIIAESAAAMGWRVLDHGFEMTLSKHIPGLIARNIRPWLTTWLGGHGLAVEDVGSWAIHPGGPKILSAVEEGLDLPADALATSRGVLADCGNMSSPTVLFIADRLRKANAPRPCVMIGFGPGLVAEAVLWR